jgi:asparagine synthase (glutamine-hydrolysing)
MCGISGIINKNGAPVDQSMIERITDLVSHRGPDGKGYYHGPGFAFGHRRLSIIDLSTHGAQPMSYLERYWITYNGEIYNYVEVRAELSALGYTWSSGADTEVILAAYAEWGPSCCARFNGMWAFAIHDTVEQRIFLSRDRYGVKPLYYTDDTERFVFGSEIKQLLALQSRVRANRYAVVEALLTSIDGHTTDTYFDGVRSFPQGHSGFYDLRTNRLEISRFYELTIDQDIRMISQEEAADRFHALFEDAVRLRLRSDVRVGTCLSGGLDSSATSAVGSRLYRHATQDRFIGIHAKSTDVERDESRFARLAAQHANIELHVIEPQPDDFLNTIDELIVTQEEPFGSPSMFMGWHVFQRARELGCKVMLNGQGGDEILLGYERYFATFLRSVSVFAFLREARAQARNSKLRLRDVLAYSVYFTSPTLRIARLKQRSMLKASVKDAFDFDVIKRNVASFQDLDTLQLSEISSLQLPHLLRYEDRNSMRHSIETRLPFLDYRLVNLAVSLASHQKIHNGWTKYVLRRSMAKELPEAIAWRRDKMGFEAPERSWIGGAESRMKDEIARSAILSEIADVPKLLAGFSRLPLRRRWAYFMLAAWERRQGVSW